MIFTLLFPFFVFSDEFLDKKQAKDVVDSLYSIEAEIRDHMKNLEDFSTRFDFLIAHDKKLRNKIHYIQYLNQLKNKQKSLLGLIEILVVPKNNIQNKNGFFIKDNSTSIFKKIISDGNDFYFYPVSKNASINKITFEATNIDDCIIKDYNIMFKTKKSNQPIKIIDQVLYLNQTIQTLDFPSHVSFTELIIQPKTVWGNDTMICIPNFHVFGDKSFQPNN